MQTKPDQYFTTEDLFEIKEGKSKNPWIDNENMKIENQIISQSTQHTGNPGKNRKI